MNCDIAIATEKDVPSTVTVEINGWVLKPMPGVRFIVRGVDILEPARGSLTTSQKAGRR